MSLCGRRVKRKVFEEGLDGGQTQVAGANAIAAASFAVLEILQKRENGLGVDIFDSYVAQPWCPGMNETQQQFERIAVAPDRIWAQLPLLAKI